jgi:hypothetical protein
VAWSYRFSEPVTRFTQKHLSHRFAANSCEPMGALGIEHWPAIEDDLHNMTTDMVHWNGWFYLAYVSSPWHIGSHLSRVCIQRSRDARHWEFVRDFHMRGEDIRDPKLVGIGDALFLYVLKNVGVVAEPCQTAFCSTQDGIHWSDIQNIEPFGWLFWRPKTANGRDWYVAAYWHKHGKSILLHSQDGITWKQVSEIYNGDFNDETDIEFLSDGRLVVTARLEMNGSIFGHRQACTWVGISEPPYKTWTGIKCEQTRLDGPNLFSWNQKVYALGRRHLDRQKWMEYRGSLFGRKRTSLYEVTLKGLEFVSDLPSSGDTGYPGVVIQQSTLFVSYYTNQPERDYPAFVGLFLPSQIRIAKLDLNKLDSVRGEIKAPAPELALT